MKKAIIDQMLLGLFIFVALVVLGATISDNTEARDKYYNLKKQTDNAVLTVGKCYVNVSADFEECKNIYYDMLPKTNLGNEIKDSIYFEDIVVDIAAGTIEIVAKIDNYQQETFWFKFLDLAFFNLDVYSKAIIETNTSNTNSSSTYSYAIAPFAINCADATNFPVYTEVSTTSEATAEEDTTTAGNCEGYTIGSKFDLTYDLVTNWDYTDKNKMYPIIPSSLIIDGDEYGQNCTSPYLLSDKYDKDDWALLGFDWASFSWDDANCTEIGADLFPDYANNIIPAMTSMTPMDIDFNTDNVSSLISLLGIFQGNLNSTMMEQGTEIEKVFDAFTFPISLDIVTLDSQGKANGVVRLQIDSYSYKNSSKEVTLNVVVAGSEYKTVKLVE